MLFAQGGPASWDILHIIIAIIIIAAAVGIMYVVLQVFGVSIPQWVVKIFWIVIAAVVGILAIKFLWSMSW